MGVRLVDDWRRLWDVTLIKQWELDTSESGMKLWKEEQWPRVDKERNPTWRRKWENAISGKQMDSVRKETHVASVMNVYLAADTRRSDEQDNRPLPHQIRRQRQTLKNPSKKQERTKPFGQRGRIPRWFENCKNPSCNYWHPRAFQNYKPETGCI